MSMKRRLTIVDGITEASSIEGATLKMAFASTDMKHVNQHFGSAESFVIYAVDLDQMRMLEVIQFDKLDEDGNEDKLVEKIKALDGCVAVYSQAVGSSAVAKLKAEGIQPVKVAAGTEINDMLESVQEELRSGPATWLARAIESQKPNDPNRFADMELEGWDE
ncbi:MAG: nitrogen fixation protein NifX [Gammaproteobacteria bacterium]